MGQALLNLLHNAVKFSPTGSAGTVDVTAAETEVVVAVADHGQGIPRSALPRIFERFYKVDRARTRGAGGTGLGLSIARHIVEAHGGRIWAESEEGIGSTFSFAIPAHRAGPRGDAGRLTVLLLAHRGDHREAPENTLAAFVAALAIPGVDGLELDVRASADGVAVVLHDASLARVQGRRLRASRLTVGRAGHPWHSQPGRRAGRLPAGRVPRR